MKLAIRVKTRASKNKLIKNPDGSYVAYLTASPVRGEANKSLIDLLSEELDVVKSSIRIVKGPASKNKIVEIA